MNAGAHLTSLDDGTRILTLSNPAKRNALDPAMCAALATSIASVANDRAARSLIVTGEGDAFCAGADLPAMFGDLDRPVPEIRAGLREAYASFLGIRALSIPVIAAVTGPAIGAGLNIALSCDLVIASPTATFGATFARIGLHPGGGATAFLVESLGRQRATRLLLEGGTLSAQDALSWGLVESVTEDPLREARTLAAKVALLEPELARNIKEAVRLATQGPLEPVVSFESWAQAASAKGERVAAAVAKFRKRGAVSTDGRERT
ncbi:enoyl-CoA hydratase [Amycolatopsis sulphurea]|uniref:Enoyl-CoA hydratase n=1 Tax=Amycolatopsis sulphurea TaxID=76022 RepID=A0A2A9FJM1_9PSEU|nr:enoyl-CoA hydratase-related protein [Amycolatopsis sulphurea]PFG50649.1 enoyl-CoA hydratase [Amycolatopsis sulphurea]